MWRASKQRLLLTQPWHSRNQLWCSGSSCNIAMLNMYCICLDCYNLMMQT